MWFKEERLAKKREDHLDISFPTTKMSKVHFKFCSKVCIEARCSFQSIKKNFQFLRQLRMNVMEY